jgi:poly(A) polymerase
VDTRSIDPLDDQLEPQPGPSGLGDGIGRALPRVVTSAEIPDSVLDQDALRVISRLTRHGHQAYLVGGCVRDLLLGRHPKDFDVATSAHPRQVKRLFRNGRIIGRRFKLVHIAYGGHIIETATFRREPTPRAPGQGDADLLIVEDNEFGSAEEDARRRDFTINALFLDPARRRILDYVGGLHDLEQGVLRTIGDPRVRMAEDPVRILRAIKFATRLALRIETGTWEAMIEVSPELGRSARPRVLEEILRLLRSGTALGAFRMLRRSSALSVILPEVDHFLGLPDDPDPLAHDRADSYWRLLEALDADVHSGNWPTTAVCIAALYLRIIERESNEETRTLRGPAGDLGQVADEVLVPFSKATRLSRRDCSRAVRIIEQQRRFTQPSTRTFSRRLFALSEEFPEALHLFRLRSMAWGQGWELYEAWLERLREVERMSPDELEKLRDQNRTTRRRRRRRRRKPGGPSAA